MPERSVGGKGDLITGKSTPTNIDEDNPPSAQVERDRDPKIWYYKCSEVTSHHRSMRRSRCATMSTNPEDHAAAATTPSGTARLRWSWSPASGLPPLPTPWSSTNTPLRWGERVPSGAFVDRATLQKEMEMKMEKGGGGAGIMLRINVPGLVDFIISCFYVGLGLLI